VGGELRTVAPVYDQMAPKVGYNTTENSHDTAR
jgi:hypothetical protein